MWFDLHKGAIKQTIVGILFLITPSQLFGQNLSYAREVTNTLASARFQGRGYINKGDSLAASWINNEIRSEERRVGKEGRARWWPDH